jgi:energy-converting hydrogenase B subunit D
MELFSIIMIVFLIGASIAVSLIKDLFGAIVVFMAYSLIMAILWEQLNAPDLAITEAAVGAGVTTVLFVISLKRIRRMKR